MAKDQEIPEKSEHITIVIMGFLLALASTFRYPILEDLELFKYLTFISAFIASLWILPFAFQGVNVRSKFALLYVLLLMKFFYGFIVAILFFGQSFLDTFLEARFALLGLSAPLWWYFFSRCGPRVALKIAWTSAFFSLLIYASAFIYFSEALEIGHRAQARVHVSAFIPVALALAGGLACNNRQAIVLCLILIFSTFFLSTSRTDLALGIISILLLSVDKTKFRSIFLVVAVGILMLALSALVFALAIGAEFEQRDLGSMREIFARHWLFGVGYSRDLTLLESFPTVDKPFWFSDYGVLTYLVRYGVFGWFLTLAVVIFIGLTLRAKTQFLWFTVVIAYSLVTPLSEYFGIGFAIALGLLPLLNNGKLARSGGSVLTRD